MSNIQFIEYTQLNDEILNNLEDNLLVVWGTDKRVFAKITGQIDINKYNIQLICSKHNSLDEFRSWYLEEINNKTSELWCKAGFEKGEISE